MPPQAAPSGCPDPSVRCNCCDLSAPFLARRRGASANRPCVTFQSESTRGGMSNGSSPTIAAGPLPCNLDPPPGIGQRSEYELLTRARSYIKSHGESGTHNSAGNDSFNEPTGSTPERNGNLHLDDGDGRAVRRRDRSPPDGPDSSDSDSSSSSDRGGGRRGGQRDEDDPDGDFAPTPRPRRSKSRKRKSAEAAEIKLEPLKPIARYAEWCSSLADAVMAASGRGDRVWNWIQAPAQVNATMGALSVPGDKYRSLDAKLAKALRTAANGNTTHQQRIQEEFGRATAEEEARNRPIRGRQLLLIVHAYYRTNEE